MGKITSRKNISDMVAYAVREVFSFVSKREVTNDELYKHVIGKLGKRFNLTQQCAKGFYFPIYWALVGIGGFDGEHPLFLEPRHRVRGKKKGNVSVDYVRVGEGLKPDCPLVFNDICQRVLGEYGQCLEAKLGRFMKPAQPA